MNCNEYNDYMMSLFKDCSFKAYEMVLRNGYSGYGANHFSEDVQKQTLKMYGELSSVYNKTMASKFLKLLPLVLGTGFL